MSLLAPTTWGHSKREMPSELRGFTLPIIHSLTHSHLWIWVQIPLPSCFLSLVQVLFWPTTFQFYFHASIQACVFFLPQWTIGHVSLLMDVAIAWMNFKGEGTLISLRKGTKEYSDVLSYWILKGSESHFTDQRQEKLWNHSDKELMNKALFGKYIHNISCIYDSWIGDKCNVWT